MYVYGKDMSLLCLAYLLSDVCHSQGLGIWERILLLLHAIVVPIMKKALSFDYLLNRSPANRQ